MSHVKSYAVTAVVAVVAIALVFRVAPIRKVVAGM